MDRKNVLRIGNLLVSLVIGMSLGMRLFFIGGILLVALIFLFVGTYMKE